MDLTPEDAKDEPVLADWATFMSTYSIIQLCYKGIEHMKQVLEDDALFHIFYGNRSKQAVGAAMTGGKTFQSTPLLRTSIDPFGL